MIIDLGVLSEDQFFYANQLETALKKGFKHIVIFDDFIGSGEQIDTFWNYYKVTFRNSVLSYNEIAQTLLKEEERLPVEKKSFFEYLSLVATREGINYIEGDNCSLLGLSLNYCEILEEEHRVFSDKTIFFENLAERNEAQIVLYNLIKDKDISLYGFNSLDYAVAFTHTIPDSALPIFLRVRKVIGNICLKISIHIIKMVEYDNPFSIDRAEHLGDELYKYFVPHARFQVQLKRKSILIKGGRGCGKTMFFLYNSYEQKKKQAINSGKNFNEFIKDEEFIGVYFRADSDFVTAFEHKGLKELEWQDLFAHYFNLAITKRIAEVASDIEKKITLEKTKETCKNIIISLGIEDEVNSYSELYKILVRQELILMRYINNIGRFEKPITTVNGSTFNILVNGLVKEEYIQNKVFHVFVDEYENLLYYQQTLINTLVKHPDPTVINIGMRKEGMLSRRTLAKKEFLSTKHDYDVYDFEKFTPNEYKTLLIESCRKRLKTVGQFSNLPDDHEFLDIRFYLGEYKPVDEAKSIIKESTLKLDKFIKDSIFKELSEIKDPKEVKRLYNLFTSNSNPIINRLNLVLLTRKSFSVQELALDFNNYLQKKASRYYELYKNNNHGIVYLLAKEGKRKKKYYGFNAYSQLSSNIIRFFHEFCDLAFRNAFRKNFTFDNPRPLSPEEQTRAVALISELKFNDIETYAPYGARLKRFIYLLGNIFSKLHTNPKQSEPEQNHFATSYDNLDEESKLIIKNAIMWSVLQEHKETKKRLVQYPLINMNII